MITRVDPDHWEAGSGVSLAGAGDAWRGRGVLGSLLARSESASVLPPAASGSVLFSCVMLVYCSPLRTGAALESVV